MSNLKAKTSVAFLTCGAALAGVWLGARAQAQPSLGTAENFTTSEYFDAPNEKQIKSLITGAEAQPQPGGRYLLKQLKLETFRVTGEGEIVIEAPECLYDSVARTAGSGGRLQIQSGDGRFSVAGEGFLWQEREGRLTISNRVRSVIQRTTTNAVTEATAPLVITSRWFSFEATNHCAAFHEEVHGDDPEMEFTCGQLAVRAGPGGRSFEVIEAGQSPVITGKADGRRVTADRAVYTRADERAELVSNVSWQQGRHSGRADRAVVLRLEKDFSAEGHVAMKLPRELLGAGGLLLSGSNAPVATADTNAPLLDLFADRFHSRSNLLVAEGAVRLMDVTNRLSCDKLTMQSATASAPDESAMAEGNVVVERGGGSLRAARAVYAKSDATIVFTGEPQWTQAQMEGRAERVTIHSETGEIHAENRVTVKLAVRDQRASFLTFFPAVADTNSAPQEIEVRAREFTAKERRVIFLGDVRAHQLPVSGSEPRLQCDELEVKFAATGPKAESLQARNNVVYRQGLPGSTNGPAMYRQLSTRTLTARSDPATGALLNLAAEGDVQIEQLGNRASGGRATYTAATDFLELTDSPVLETSQILITNARTLFWDNANARFTGTGPFKIRFKTEAVKQTAEKLKTP
jgi:lipopolysaccharide export system protein LptA